MNKCKLKNCNHTVFSGGVCNMHYKRYKRNGHYGLKNKLKSKTRFYRIWFGMRSRCNNANNCSYHKYGGVGIRVCDRWDNFNNFYEDMYNDFVYHAKVYGEKNTTIDRIDNDYGYKIENCRWATYSVQNYNRRRYKWQT